MTEYSNREMAELHATGILNDIECIKDICAKDSGAVASTKKYLEEASTKIMDVLRQIRKENQKGAKSTLWLEQVN